MKVLGWSVLVLVFGNLSAHAEFDWKKAQRQYEENVRIASRYPFREFEQAAKSGDVATVKRLLDQGVPVSLQIPWPEDSFEGIPPCEQAIHHATANDHLEVVRLLLDQGADPNAHGGEGATTPLHLTNNPELARLLISRGANLAARDIEGQQPIHHAVSCAYPENRRKEAVANSLALVNLLIAHGANPLAEDEMKRQPIHLAANYGAVEIVSLLLENKAKADAKTMARPDDPNVVSDSEYGWQPLHYAAARFGFEESPDCTEDFEIAKLLIQKGADVNAAASNGATPLHLAKNPAVVGFLLEKGANANAATSEGKTPLHFPKNPSITRLLLDHGAKVNATTIDSRKEQPIHHFAEGGDVESLKLLLDRGADIGAVSADDEQSTPLDAAVFWGKTDAVKLLLKRGATPTERTMKNARRFDTTPVEILGILHQHGGIVSADMFLRFPKDRKTLLPLLDQKAKDDLIKHSAEHIAEAAEAGDLGIIRDLVALGAKTDQPWKHLLPIHHAVASGKQEVVQYFLSAGQPIDAKCTARDEDLTPPMVFTNLQPIHLSFGKPDLIPFLIKKGAKIDAATGEGWQTIHFAAAFGESNLLKAVFQAGGNPAAKTSGGKTPLQLAEEFKQEDSVKFLKSLK